MSATALRWNGRRTKTYFLSTVAILTLIAGYVVFLQYEENRMERYYASLRSTQPAVYLSKLAQLRGFDTYLKEFASLRSYEQPQDRVPPFLLGRWALFQTEQQVGDHYFPDACLSGAEIEDGTIRLFGEYKGGYQVQYKIAGGKVEAVLDNGDVILVTPQAYGAHLHHIEIALPGQQAPLYGYICK